MTELPEDVRRRLATVFGDLLPEVTRDEVDLRTQQRDDELLENRPPHYDR